MIYLDTSVLIAYYIPEALSEKAQQSMLSAPSIVVSELTETEFISALALRQRIGDISLESVQQVSVLFFKHMEDGLYRALHLDTTVFHLARDYIGRFDLPLKAPDALHLAAANREGLPLVTADRQLARNARTLGVDVELLEI